MRKLTLADIETEALECSINGHTTRVEVLPRVGATMTSLAIDGEELLHFDAGSLLADVPDLTGCFHMFPTPCALRNCSYEFEGAHIRQRKRGADVYMHGLVRDELFDISKTPTELTAALEFDERHPVHEGFPFPGRFSIIYRHIPLGIEIEACFENHSGRRAPVGYGIHPYWRIPQDRSDVLVRIPASHRLELGGPKKQLPTGRLLPVDGTRYDLRDSPPLAGRAMDDVFFPVEPGARAGLSFVAKGTQLTITYGDNMTHMICYNTENEPFVCLENLTCAPDAPNLYSKGVGGVAGLTIIEPGERLQCWVRYVLGPVSDDDRGAGEAG